jgi:FAD/FMN-containing dehydrogenase
MQGGGHGFATARYGVTADNVVAVEAVVYNTTKGGYSPVLATPTNEHAHLLAALRGGMGGQYGVVTAMHLATFVAPQVRHFSGPMWAGWLVGWLAGWWGEEWRATGGSSCCTACLQNSEPSPPPPTASTQHCIYSKLGTGVL